MKKIFCTIVAVAVMAMSAVSADAALPTATKKLYFKDAKFTYTQNGVEYKDKSLSELPTNQGTTTSNHNNLLSNITITWEGEDVVVSTPATSFNTNIGLRSYGGGLAVWGWNGSKRLLFKVNGSTSVKSLTVTAPAGRTACVTSDNNFKTGWSKSDMDMAKASDNSWFSITAGTTHSNLQVEYSGISYGQVVWDSLEITYVTNKTDNLKSLLEMFNADNKNDVNFEGMAYVVYRGESNLRLQDAYGNGINVVGYGDLVPAYLNKGYALTKFSGKFSGALSRQNFILSSAVTDADCVTTDVTIEPAELSSAPNSSQYGKFVKITGPISGFSSGVADRLEMTKNGSMFYLTQVKPYWMPQDENGDSPENVSPLADGTNEYHFVSGGLAYWPHSGNNKLEFVGDATATGFVGYSNGKSSVQCIELVGQTKTPTVTGIEDVTVSDRDTVKVAGNDIIAPAGSSVYNANGAKVGLTGLGNGIYMVVTPAGTVHKVLVR